MKKFKRMRYRSFCIERKRGWGRWGELTAGIGDSHVLYPTLAPSSPGPGHPPNPHQRKPRTPNNSPPAHPQPHAFTHVSPGLLILNYLLETELYSVWL